MVDLYRIIIFLLCIIVVLGARCYWESKNRKLLKKTNEVSLKAFESATTSIDKLKANLLICTVNEKDNYITINALEKGINKTDKVKIIYKLLNDFNLEIKSLEISDKVNDITTILVNKNEFEILVVFNDNYIKVACNNFDELISIRSSVVEFLN